MAPAFVTVTDDTLSEAEVEELNKEFAGVIFIERIGRDSHMWNGKTVISFFSHMTRALRMKRAELGLTAKDYRVHWLTSLTCSLANYHLSCDSFLGVRVLPKCLVFLHIWLSTSICFFYFLFSHQGQSSDYL